MQYVKLKGGLSYPPLPELPHALQLVHIPRPQLRVADHSKACRGVQTLSSNCKRLSASTIVWKARLHEQTHSVQSPMLLVLMKS